MEQYLDSLSRREVVSEDIGGLAAGPVGAVVAALKLVRQVLGRIVPSGDLENPLTFEGGYSGFAEGIGEFGSDGINSSNSAAAALVAANSAGVGFSNSRFISARNRLFSAISAALSISL
jgi:hypothetical protein